MSVFDRLVQGTFSKHQHVAIPAIPAISTTDGYQNSNNSGNSSPGVFEKATFQAAPAPTSDPIDRGIADDATLAEVAALMGVRVADLYIVGLAADRLNISPATLAARLRAGATPDDLKEIGR